MGMYQYARNLELLYETPAELPIDIAPPKHNLQAMLRRVAASGRTVLTEEESKRFITTYGFPVIAQVLSDDVEEALAAADEDRLPGRAQDRVARHHAQERSRRRRGGRLLAGRPGDCVRAHDEAREEEFAQGRDRGRRGPEDGARR